MFRTEKEVKENKKRKGRAKSREPPMPRFTPSPSKASKYI
jgi:hypothetical protein